MVVSVYADELIKFVCELRLPVLVDQSHQALLKSAKKKKKSDGSPAAST
jgi:hypothetical protein